MKTIWTVIGVIVLLAIIYWLYKRSKMNSMTMAIPPVMIPTPRREIVTNTTQPVIIQPIIVQNPSDCNQAYQDNVVALYDIYRQKRVIYNTAISTNSPTVNQARIDMNVAYNTYYHEGLKCSFLPYK